MESTIKIHYESSPSKPIIKIISPKQLDEDCDVKDVLVQHFLHTPSVVDRNTLFELQSYYDLNTPYKVSMIAPLDYFDILERLVSHTAYRVMSADDVNECHEFYERQKSIILKESDNDCATKCPANYETYLKIRGFFDWVGAQPYIEKSK